MYINPVDDNNIRSFLQGFEIGATDKRDFIELLKTHLIENYKIEYSSDGWPGQIKKLAKRNSLNWTTTFKKIGLEIIVKDYQGNLDEEFKTILKSRINLLINRIQSDGNPWFNESWKEEWLSFCCLENDWFKLLWLDNELKIIAAIDNEVHSNNIFDNKIPSRQLIEIKGQYDRLTKKNGT